MKFAIGSKVIYTPVNSKKGIKPSPSIVEVISYNEGTGLYVVYLRKPGYRQKKLIAEHLLSEK